MSLDLDAPIAKSRRSGAIAASAFLDDPSQLEAVACDVQREAEEIRHPVALATLHTRLEAVAGAHRAGDRAALRAELVNLAAAAVQWAARLPRPRRRRRGKQA